MFIYKITNTINHKVYIGQTSMTLESRWKNHIADSKNSKYLDYPLYVDFYQYGIDKFNIRVIDEVTIPSTIDMKEVHWIDHYDSTNPEKGYNRQSGGKGKYFGASKPVVCVTNNKRYLSATHASEILDIPLSKICAVCRGERYSTGGMRFAYVGEEDKILKHKYDGRKPVVNKLTGEVYPSIEIASVKNGIKRNTLVAQLIRNNFYKNENTFLATLDFEDISQIPPKPNYKPNSKSIKRLDTNETFLSIREGAKSINKEKSYRNLATSLRKGDGQCTWNKIDWIVIN